MTINRCRSLAYGLVAIIGLSGIALAHPRAGEGCEHGRPLKRLEGRLDNLGLQPQTLETARALLDKAREQRRASHGELRQARDRMHELMLDEKPDVDAVLAQVDTIGGLETRAKKERLRTLLELRALLTSEQWAQLNEPPAGEKDHHHKPRLY
jgi:Spy/CpxP family protein refolding chaperone